jgi:hypothetical protein
MRKTLRWAAIGATVATAGAVLSVTTMAGAATAPAAKPTSLTIAASKSVVTAGGTEVVSGTLKTGHTALAGEPVSLDTVDVHGALHKTGLIGVTAKNTGLVTFKFTPKATATYELVFPGAKGLSAAHSGKAVVKVNRIATKLAIATSASSIKAGGKATITGTLTAGTTPLAGRGIFLFKVDAQGHLVARVGQPHVTAKTTGQVSFTVSPLTTTSYALVWPGGWQYAPSRSATVKITVTKTATTLALTASSASIKKGSTVTLTGKLAAGTTALKGEVVELYTVDAKGVLHLVQNGAKFTSATGTVTFTRAPGATTKFELVFRATALLAGSKSAAVTVTVTP